jgi:hemolysin III
MYSDLTPRQTYSRAETRSDAVVHAIGLGFALIGAPVLLAVTIVLSDRLDVVVAVAVYGGSLIGMMLASTLFNHGPGGTWQPLLRQIDHSAIFIKIVGTYTPLLILTGGQWGWALLALWMTAALGVGFKFLDIDRYRWIGVVLYLLLGWGGVLLCRSFLQALPPAVFGLVASGAVFYTVGVLFYLLDRLPFHYTIWHVCVLAGTVAFYAAVLLLILSGAI